MYADEGKLKTKEKKEGYRVKGEGGGTHRSSVITVGLYIFYAAFYKGISVSVRRSGKDGLSVMMIDSEL